MNDGDNPDDASRKGVDRLLFDRDAVDRARTDKPLPEKVDGAIIREPNDAAIPDNSKRRLLRALSSDTAGFEPDPREEPLLITLDQLRQTLDVMHGVVGRLRHQIEEQTSTPEDALRSALRADRVLH